jgi:predicted DNA-binding transcriptional regulator AlpA
VTKQKTIEQDALPVAELPDPRTKSHPKLLSKEQVLARLGGVTYNTLWFWVRAGKFPPARQMVANGRLQKIGWLESEVNDWILSRPPRIPNPKGSKKREVA